MIPIAGFMPDADPTTPGVLVDCADVVPSIIGYESAKSLVTPLNVPALADVCMGAATITKLDGTRRTFAATETAIYELVSGAWTDVTRATAYNGGSESYWYIAQFGDASLLSNGVDVIQRSTSGAFADISGAPAAQIVFSVGAFVMALNTNTSNDQWHCCAAYDDTDWIESVTTQSASGRLVATPGEITAGGKLGEYAIAYKQKSIYIGQYVGGEIIWDWTQLPGPAGCVGKWAWCDVNGVHFFVGLDNFWLFNGTTTTPLADGVVREWFADNCSVNYKYKIICQFDKTTNLVWIFYPSANNETNDSALVYHIQKKQWGRVQASIEAAMEYTTGAITIDDLDSYATTIDTLPDIPLDSPFWNAGARSLAVFNTSHQLQTFVGTSGTSSITTGDVGDDYQYSCLTRVKIRFNQSPTSSTLQSYHKQESGDNWTAGPSATLTNNRYDLLQSARWHRAVITFEGNHSITGMDAKYEADGEE